MSGGSWMRNRACVARLVEVGALFAVVLSTNLAPVRAQTVTTLRQSGRIGCESCRDERLLSSVLAVTIGPGGTVYVADLTRPKLRAFTPSGRRVFAAVEEGRQTGQSVVPVGVIATDSMIYLFDVETSRVTLVTPSGDIVGDHRLAQAPVAVAYRAPFGHFFFAAVDFGAEELAAQVWKMAVGDTVPERVFTTDDDGFPRGRDGTPSPFLSLAMTPTGGFALGEGAFAYGIRLYD
jgi:hypothetical protein